LAKFGLQHILHLFLNFQFGFIGFPCFDLYQAHDIIVVELAPPPPRESNGEEADTAVDADAAVPAVVPKVAEKKKVFYFMFFLLFCDCHSLMHRFRSLNRTVLYTSKRNMSAITWVALGWRRFLLTSGHNHRCCHLNVLSHFSVLYSITSGLWLAKAFPNHIYPKHAFISGRVTPRLSPSSC
jgi:hypothetical protein